MVEDDVGMRNLIFTYYITLFESHAGDHYEDLLQHMPLRISMEMNGRLGREVSSEEIKATLDGIGDLKALEAHGMLALFYKQF